MKAQKQSGRLRLLSECGGRREGITGDFEVLNPVNERLAVVL